MLIKTNVREVARLEKMAQVYNDACILLQINHNTFIQPEFITFDCGTFLERILKTQKSYGIKIDTNGEIRVRDKNPDWIDPNINRDEFAEYLGFKDWSAFMIDQNFVLFPNDQTEWEGTIVFLRYL